MARYVARRLALAPLVLMAIAILVFLLVRLVPGDAVSRLISGQGSRAGPEQMETLRRLFGLDLPIQDQFTAWLGGLLRGDLGVSLVNGRSISADIVDRLAATIELAFLAMLVMIVVGIPLGVIAATRHGRWPDLMASGLGLLGIAIPSFWLATLLVLVFAVGFHLLPSAGYVPFIEDPVGNLRLMVLPVLALGLAEAAVVARATRSAMITSMAEDHVRTARAKGAPERVVLRRHALRTALVPIVTVAGLSVGYLLSGAIIVEEIFGIPGIGRYALGGINDRDYPVVQGAVLVIALIYFAVNLLVDVLVAVVDPRVRERA